MTTLAEARDGLEARLKTISGLRVYDYIPDDAIYPAAFIRRNPIVDYSRSLAYGGEIRATFSVVLLVPAVNDRQQLDLYPFLEKSGAQSIPALIEADHTLGGLNVDARATSADDVNPAQMGLTNLYGTSIEILVIIS